MSANDFRNLAKRLRVRAKHVTKNSDELVRRVTRAVVSNLVIGDYGVVTPVLTGRARSNWRTLFYRPDNVLHWPPPDKPDSPSAGAYRALAEMEDTVSSYSGRRSIWVTNNVPYIRSLNDGSSAQAPAGFVERAVAAGKAEVGKVKSLLAEMEL